LLAFYADDSADAKREILFVVAGLVADTSVWFEVERLWNKRLDRDGLEYFRASDCNSLTGEFYKLVKAHGPNRAREMANDLLADLKEIIKARELYAFIFMGPMAVYRRARAKDFGKNCLHDDPYIQAHEQIVFEVAKSAGKGKAKSPIAFVFDEHCKAKQLLAGWADLKRRLPATSQWIGSATVLDDKQCAQLQVADLIANIAKRACEKVIAADYDHSYMFELEEWRDRAHLGYWDDIYLEALIHTTVDFHTSPVPIPTRSIDEL